jgi:hypothetical protein
MGGVTNEVVISSYHLEWDAGTLNGPWVELVGLSSAYTLTSYSTNPSNPAEVLVPGQYYRFRVRAQNQQGFGAWSSTQEILAASVPGQMAMVTVADNANVPSTRITWTLPNANGSPISQYLIKI